MVDNKVSSFIGNKLPLFVREDYSKFVNFIQDCYGADERRGSSLDLLRNILTYKDFTNFDYIQNNNVKLSVSIDENDTEITVNDGSKLPSANGVIRIDDEIILYKTRTGDTLNDCLRGSSYVTKLNDIYTAVEYTNSISVSHDADASVIDLTTLCVFELLGQTYSNFLPTISDDWIDDNIRRSTILSRINSFYRSKGSEEGIRILFKLIYGDIDIDIFYPGEQMLKCSDSDWSKRDVIKCELISGNIDVVSNNTLYQIKDNYDSTLEEASVLVEDVKKILYEDGYIYELNVNPNYKAGDIRVCPKTVLSRQVGLSDTVITVESTYGFPVRNGKFYIGDEEITYSYKTSNQFHGCSRLFPITHLVGENVFGVGFVYSYLNNETTVLRVIGVLSNINVKNPGLFNVSEQLSIGDPGQERIGEALIETWIENTDSNLCTVADSTVYDVSKYTYGINSVYFDDNNVFVQSSSLPSNTIGPFGTSDELDLRPVYSYCKFPRNPVSSNVDVSVGTESIGMFVDGIMAQSHCVDERVINGSVTKINVESGGYGYNSPPFVIISGGGGSGVVASSELSNGRVTSITLTNGGSNFTSIPSVRITSGENAVLEPTIDAYGRVKEITVSNGGQYYTDPPRIIVVDPTDRGRGAILIVDPDKIIGGVIQSDAIRIVNPGIDYSQQSYVIVNPIGSDAAASAEVYSYITNSYVYGENKYDSSGGYVYPRRVGSSLIRNTYCYSANPQSLRTLLSDDGVNHSPILGFAFDGYPIYGPYGYTQPMKNTSGVVRMTSSYQLSTRPGTNPPSTITYPLGTFIQDYVYVENSGSLDEHNGRFCVTPEYPNGTYAYFLTVDNSDVPVYPYIIGPTFKGLPTSQNVNFLGDSSVPDLTELNVINQNFYGETSVPTYDYSFTVRRRNSNLSILNRDIEADIITTSKGSIQRIYVDYSDNNYAVGDLCKFDYTGNSGSGCEAKVSWVVGDEITSLNISVPNVRVFTHDQQIDFSLIEAKSFTSSGIDADGDVIRFSAAHEFRDGTRVLYTNITGDNPDGLIDGRAYFVKVVDSTTIKLTTTLKNLSNGVFVDILDSGTGNKEVKPIYSFSIGRTISTENGSEFVVIDWDDNLQLLNLKILNQTRVVPNDVFRDNVGSTVYVPLDSIAIPNIGTDSAEIPVTSVTSLRSGDIIQIGAEVMTVSGIGTNKVLKVIRDDTVHPDISNDAYVVNLSRLAIIVTTKNGHDLSIGDTVEIIGASPEFMNGATTVGDILDETTFVCFKKLSESDSNTVFTSASNPDSLVVTTTIQPFYIPDLTSGRLWWSPLTGSLYIYYIDDNSSQWVGAIPTGVISNQLGEFTDPTPISGDPASDSTLVTGTIIQISQVAPTTRKNGTELKQGDLWWSSLTGYLYIYFDGHWVPATPNAVVPRADESASTVVMTRDELVIDGTGELLIIDTVGNETFFTNEYYGTGVPGDITEREAIVTVSLTPPVDGVDPVQDGDLWWSTFSGFLYIRYNSKWVVATPIGSRPTEGASTTPVSNAKFEDIDFLVLIIATGDFYFVTTSLSVVGPIHRLTVSSPGISLNILPDIVGVYPRELDRAVLQPVINIDGSISSVNIVSGGNRYKNPKVLFLSQKGIGAIANVTVSNGTITNVTMVENGRNYSTGDLEILVVETGNVLIPISNNIGKILTTKTNMVGSYLNTDPTLSFEIQNKLKCTIINLDGNFIIGSKIQSTIGKFEGIVADWDANRRLLTISNHSGILSEGDVVITQHATGTVLQSGQSEFIGVVDSLVNLNGEFITSKSVISSSYQKLIDSYYYQDFSYVINSNIQINDYRNITLNNTHPAGFILFGELQLSDQLNIVQSLVTSEISIS